VRKFRVPDAVQREAMRRRAGTHEAPKSMDPGSAAHRFALRSIRGTCREMRENRHEFR
jgi:hypothetical protein